MDSTIFSSFLDDILLWYTDYCFFFVNLSSGNDTFFEVRINGV